MAVDQQKLKDYIHKEFDQNAIPGLEEYIKIPNLSQMFDPEWNTNGLLEKAADHLVDWFKKQEIKGSKIEVLNEDMKAPLIFIEIDRTDDGDDTILFYGHYDKQPHCLPWKEGLGPTTPVIQDGKLYGRGSSDDGYSIFSATLSVKGNQALGRKHPRICMMIEGAEESSSANFLYYLEKLEQRIGKPKLIVCLDSGCGNYDTMWLTSTLRGNIKAELSVKVLEEGVHSGDASGIVPDSFRILRSVLNRLENEQTGLINENFQVEIPEDRYKECQSVASILNEEVYNVFPFINDKMVPVSQDPLEAYLNRTWRPQLAVVGIDGIPSCGNAGNVLRPETKIRVSLRTPPTLDCKQVQHILKDLLEKEAPYGAKVEANILSAMTGFNSPPLSEDIQKSLENGCKYYFGNELLLQGEGGSIPLMGLLSNKWPGVQLVVTGILGPNSNAHGPNEFLHIEACKNVTCCLTQMVGDIAIRK